ncbi:MAG: AbrB/MazE/SpoVT family DNA-binding domain-containing protein [Gammaproteobacteria bacterium]
MTSLRTIGNSQGILIPKALIHKANLEGRELELEVTADGLLIKPINKSRANWQAAIASTLEAHAHDIDHEWLDAELIEEDENNDEK